MVRSPLTRRRASGDDGISLILVALCLVAICAVAAITIDLGNARQVGREEQGGVDAAALAAARNLPIQSTASSSRVGKQNQARAAGMEYAVRNLASAGATVPTCASGVYVCTATVDGVTITVTTPWDPNSDAMPANPNPGGFITQMGYVHVEACQDTPSFFAGVINNSSPRVCRSAVGRYFQQGGGFDFGLVATDPSQCGAMTFAGNSETVLTSNGAVMVNSSCDNGNTQALDANGSTWKLRFIDDDGNDVIGYIGVVGGTSLQPCDPETQTDNCTETVPTPGISPFGDPLSGLIPPTKPAAAATQCSNAGDQLLTPGAFTDCKKSSGNLQMEPGIYWFDGGLEFTGGAITCVDGGGKTCAGDGILMYVNTGAIKLTGNGEVYLPPYRMTCTGAYYSETCWDGISIWQASSNTSDAIFNGTDSFSIGTIYLPGAHATFNGTGGGGEQINVNGIVVTKTVDISGTFDFNIVVPDTSPDPPQTFDLGLEK